MTGALLSTNHSIENLCHDLRMGFVLEQLEKIFSQGGRSLTTLTRQDMQVGVSGNVNGMHIFPQNSEESVENTFVGKWSIVGKVRPTQLNNCPLSMYVTKLEKAN